MAPDALRLRINHLTELDRLELAKLMGAEAVRFEETRPPDGRLGELDTLTAIVTISLATISTTGIVLSIWLAKGGKKLTIHRNLLIEAADGSRVVHEVKIVGNSQDEISAEVLQGLQAAFSSASTPAKDA